MNSKILHRLVISEEEKKKYNKLRLKNLIVSLFGLNCSSYNSVIKSFGLNPNIRIQDVEFFLLKQIFDFIQKSFIIEEKKQKKLQFHKFFYIKNKHWKGFRYLKGYPVRGQRTHSNSKTSKRFTFKF